jgi:hypothetical protein
MSVDAAIKGRHAGSYPHRIKERRVKDLRTEGGYMPNITTAAKKLKITVVIDSAPLIQLGVPPDNAPPRTVVTVIVGGRTLVADIATKSIRKTVKTLEEHGPENVVLVLQGALGASNTIEEAGITAQVKQLDKGAA